MKKNLYLKNNYSTYYFNELNSNFGYNSKGSCGYVAAGMLLSFWDTYWDDNIIEEKYDARTSIQNSYIDFSENSPGIVRESSSLYYVDNETYHNNISLYQDEFFHFLLLSMGNTLYGTSAGSYGMYTYQLPELLNYYLYSYRQYSKTDVSIISTSTNVRQSAIALIKQGIPVILFISNEKSAHGVVAYDYDDASNAIYCHFGWGSNTTHVTYEEENYNDCYYMLALDFKNNHNHSNNFYYTTDGYEEIKCICSTVIPNNIACDKNYLDALPTYKWNSLINERWFKNINLYHELSILDSNRRIVYKKSYIFDNHYTLTVEEWKKAIEIPGSTYYIHIGLASDVDPYWDDYYYSKSFSEPTEYLFKTQIKPSQWGFEGRYWFENEGIKTSILSLENLNISTRRLRCGYIEDSYIVLSPRRSGAGSAYFEMNFDKKIYAFMYSVCLWSDSENLDGIAIIEVKDANGDWNQIVDIKATNQLKNKSNGLNRYIVQTPSGIYGIRFKATATATGDRNKGRLCIDDLVFSLNQNDTTFFTTDYSKTH